MATAETYTPRLKQRYNDELRPQLQEQLGLSSIMQSPTIDEDHAQHGRRRGQDRREADRRGARGADDHRRPARAGAPRPEVDRAVQDPRRDAHRRQGDAARRPDVGVPRPAGLDRAAAHPRLPRPQPRLVRRPRQLLARAFASRSSFPEIDYDSINQIRGLDVAITTTATDDEQARALLTALGLPFAADGGKR